MLFDFAVIVLILAGAALGAWKGFAMQAAGVASLAAGLAFGGPLAARLAPHLGVSAPAAFALVYIGLSFLIFAAALGVRKALERAGLRSWDRHLGAVSGALMGGALVLALSCAALAVRRDLRAAVLRTGSGRAMGAAVEALRDVLPRPLDAFLAPLRPDPPGASTAAREDSQDRSPMP